MLMRRWAEINFRPSLIAGSVISSRLGFCVVEILEEEAAAEQKHSRASAGVKTSVPNRCGFIVRSTPPLLTFSARPFLFLGKIKESG